MEKIGSGYKEIEHTADTAIQVWAADLPTLFEEAVKGMYSLTGIQTNNNYIKSHSILLKAREIESLLVMFLEELLFLSEHEGLGFERYNIDIIEGYTLSAQLECFEILRIRREIKAVTFHNMDIIRTKMGYEVVIVFDV